MRIAVTGSSSRLAAALLPLLCRHPQVERITGIDLRPATFRHSRFQAVRLDMRDPRLSELLRGHDALAHLAFRVLRGRMSIEEMRALNVTGSLQVFAAARAAGIRRLVHLSSAAVYGSGKNISEDAPLDPLPGFAYGRHKAQLERQLAAQFPECARLRCHVILGPDAQPLLAWLLAQPFYLKLADPQPQLQCVHQQDAAQAIVQCLTRGAGGAFNLAAADSFSYRDAILTRHRRAAGMPPALARALVDLGWRLTGGLGEPAWVDGLAHTLTLDCARARRELQWQPHYSSRDTLESMVPKL